MSVVLFGLSSDGWGLFDPVGLLEEYLYLRVYDSNIDGIRGHRDVQGWGSFWLNEILLLRHCGKAGLLPLRQVFLYRRPQGYLLFCGHKKVV